MPLANAGGRKVYYESHGEGAGPPLVLVMGMAGSCRGWHALQVPELSQHHRVVIYDHRGVGESEDPGGPFTHRGPRRRPGARCSTRSRSSAPTCSASSSAAWSAQELALRHPMRVAKLVLVGCYARPDAKRRLLLEKWRDDGARRDAARGVRARAAALDAPGRDPRADATSSRRWRRASRARTRSRSRADVFVRQCDACLGHDTARPAAPDPPADAASSAAGTTS